MKTKSQVRIHPLPHEDCPGNLHKFVAYANCARCGAELKRFIWAPDPFRALAIALKSEPLCSAENTGRFAGWLPVTVIVQSVGPDTPCYGAPTHLEQNVTQPQVADLADLIRSQETPL